ncbi:MAG: 50S ribosomal protein L32 [Planctomycetaceae bacterium]|jgi:large subunit ribosomal protein L32
MAVPKRRQSHARTAKRRSHNAIKGIQLTTCTKCGNQHPSHVICPVCGTYQGRVVVEKSLGD